MLHGPPETALRGFWYFGGLLVFIVMGNLLALVPGVGTIGWGHEVNGHFEVTRSRSCAA